MNIGLVLSGGGIRGVAHIGVIKALEEHNIYPTHIAGTSAGAIVGALYAGGVKWSDILEFFKVIPIFHANRFALKKPGFLDTEKFYDEFKKFFPKDSFESLPKTLYITATDIIKGELMIFEEGELIKPVLASATFPGVFSPISIDGSFYIDGGVLNNFPTEPLLPRCDKIIGSYVNPLKNIKVKDLKHSYNVIDRAYKIKSVSDSIAKFADCDLVISPEELCEFATFDMRYIDDIFEIGYKSTIKILKDNGYTSSI
ncbi:patatin-like phospholipase family protein [uncultured Maribacter sp.]|uniref:patatin-like phospholipase family protein n=1 Tax=uncultured Maribacter sp. TaxID=431308 RepID=UPI0030ECE513|tara:strand:- start:33240 stop:34007 length:768 start_codon:yes stop_codon:yes gene_type:complete